MAALQMSDWSDLAYFLPRNFLTKLRTLARSPSSSSITS